MKTEVYNLEGKQVAEKELDEKLFGLEVNHDLVYQVAVAQSANKRQANAHTKTKGEVRGGGRKPWKQKGTGNARTGSIRNPIWRGGGIIFGPRNERNFKRKINKKMRREAFWEVLSSKLKDQELKLVESFELKGPATGKISKFLEKMKAQDKSVLILTEKKNSNLALSIKNVQRVKNCLAGDISMLDLLNNKFVMLEVGALEYYNKKYAK